MAAVTPPNNSFYFDTYTYSSKKDLIEKQRNFNFDVETCLLYKWLIYRPFHKTLPRSSAFVNCISVRFYETGCI